MRKICFLTDSIFSIGGVQRVTAVIAKELSKENAVTIVTFDKPEAKDLSLYGLDEADIGYRFFSYPKEGWLRQHYCKAYSALYRKLNPQWQWASDFYAHSSFTVTLRKALTEELAAGGYDVIVGVHAPLAARLATLMPRLKGVRCIGWIHNSFEALYNPTSLYIGPQLKRHYVYQLRKLHSAVVLCHHDAKAYEDYDPQCRPKVIYNPLTLTPGLPAEGTSRQFLAVGRFSHRHKGFDLLIEAFHLFAQHNKEWTLHIVGEGPEEELYRRLISQYRLEDRVKLHPFTTNIQQYYSQAQVYVLSSRWEGFGLVLVEAMAHGLPVISSDLPTSREIMGDFGIYFKNGDTEQLAQRMEEATRIDWEQKKEEAMAIARHFDIDSIASEWKKTFEG